MKATTRTEGILPALETAHAIAALPKVLAGVDGLAGGFLPDVVVLLGFSGRGDKDLAALTRFDDGSRPDTRFREAATLGLGRELELATLRAAVDEARALLPADAWISLNVSPALLTHAEGELRDVLDVRDRDVVLELSEQEAVSDYDAMRAAVAAVGFATDEGRQVEDAVDGARVVGVVSARNDHH